jgi:holo-[acyl-carrier protein] synthase
MANWSTLVIACFEGFRVPESLCIQLCVCYLGTMIVGTGIDLVEVPRVAAAIQRYGNRFLQRVFTEGEVRYCESKANRHERFAARFAAKEAAMKALGTGWSRGIRWRDLEVRRQPGGRPTLAFHGRAAEVAGNLGVVNVSLSLTHTKEQAFAQVILET